MLHKLKKRNQSYTIFIISLQLFLYNFPIFKDLVITYSFVQKTEVPFNYTNISYFPSFK